MKKRIPFALLIALLLIFCVGCSGTEETSQATPVEPNLPTAAPTATVVATDTPVPTDTAAPTETPVLTPTAFPTDTPTPQPTPTTDPALISELMMQGHDAYFAGDYDEAVEIYSEMIRIDPDTDLYHLLRADSYVSLVEYDAAITDYIQAIELGNEDPLTFNNLCWYYGLTEQAELALPYCELAVEAEPNPMYLDSRGLIYALLGGFENATADFEMVLLDLADAMSPEEREIAAERRVWLEILRSGENPFIPEVLARLREKAQYDPLPDSAAEQNVLFAALNHFWSGRSAFNGDDFTQAIDYYSQAIELYPEFADAYYFRAIAYRFIDEPLKAVADYDRAISYEPGSSISYYLRGLTHGTLENWQLAIQDYTEAININPDIPDFYFSRGNAYLVLDQLYSCIDDMNTVLSLDPANASAFHLRGAAHYYLGNNEEAAVDLERALELGVSPYWEQMIEEMLAELRA